jgi:hypothetical protein
MPIIARGRDPVTHEFGFYGLGWTVDYGPHGVVWGHAGAFSVGARTLVSLMPSEQLGIVVLANAFPTGVPEGLANSFFDVVFEGESSRDWTAEYNRLFDALLGPAAKAAEATYGNAPPSATPALPLAAYTGTYANEYLGTATVSEEDGGLVLRVGPEGKMVFPLEHFDRDRFTYKGTPEMPDVPSPVVFAIRPDEKADSLTIADLNGIGQGVLTRVHD